MTKNIRWVLIVNLIYFTMINYNIPVRLFVGFEMPLA